MDAAKLPGGRVNQIPEILADPQIAARDLIKTLHRSDGTPVKVLGFPAKFSRTAPRYLRAPPRVGEDTSQVLTDVLGLTETEIQGLADTGVLGRPG